MATVRPVGVEIPTPSLEAAVTHVAPVPGLEPAFTVDARLGPLADHGVTRAGHRRVVPIAGGRVGGLPDGRTRLDAEILPGGADWQVVRPDGTIEIDTRYVASVDLSENIRPSRSIRHLLATRLACAACVTLCRGSHRRPAGRRKPARSRLAHPGTPARAPGAAAAGRTVFDQRKLSPKTLPWTAGIRRIFAARDRRDEGHRGIARAGLGADFT